MKRTTTKRRNRIKQVRKRRMRRWKQVTSGTTERTRMMLSMKVMRRRTKTRKYGMTEWLPMKENQDPEQQNEWGQQSPLRHHPVQKGLGAGME
jgi:hypothetical protein